MSNLQLEDYTLNQLEAMQQLLAALKDDIDTAFQDVTDAMSRKRTAILRMGLVDPDGNPLHPLVEEP
jgi:hypothetical protein